MDLKIGDIKRFNVGREEIIGVIIGKEIYNNKMCYAIIETCSTKAHIPIAMVTSDKVSQVKLDPRIRKRLEKLAELNIKYENYIREIERLKEKVENNRHQKCKVSNELSHITTKLRMDKLRKRRMKNKN